MTTAGVWEVIVNYTMFESIDFSSTFIAVMLESETNAYLTLL